jgi:Ca2+-binding RTX toxin-like protein
MATVTGTNGNDTITGTGGGVNDVLNGGRGNDSIFGLSGNDHLLGGRDNDLLVGGRGSDVLSGGSLLSNGAGNDVDTFSFSAGHITQGAVDWIVDFSLENGDVLQFLSSGGGQGFEILSVDRAYLDDTTFNGIDLANNVSTGTDLVFTVRNSLNGETQKIVLLDSWSDSLSGQWDAYLSALGYTGELGANNGDIQL